jgi:L-threonylcarbamoyladenylate synthase
LARLACFPTDTVYGVGGTLSPATVAAVIAAKGREEDKPLQVIFPNRELLLATLPLERRLTDACLRLLPGPVTLVVPYPEGFTCPPPGEVAHEEKRLVGKARSAVVRTLGVRVPRWPAPARLLETLTFPLVASSANRSGAPAPATLAAIDPAVLAACDLALDGGPAGGVASTVVDLTRYEQAGDWRVLREGAWSAADLDERLTRRRDDLPRV